MNALEEDFLKLIDFNLYVESSLFETYSQRLRNYSEK
jgi:hypothetical protein